MKITEHQLRRIIREEIEKIETADALGEGWFDDLKFRFGGRKGADKSNPRRDRPLVSPDKNPVIQNLSSVVKQINSLKNQANIICDNSSENLKRAASENPSEFTEKKKAEIQQINTACNTFKSDLSDIVAQLFRDLFGAVDDVNVRKQLKTIAIESVSRRNARLLSKSR